MTTMIADDPNQWIIEDPVTPDQHPLTEWEVAIRNKIAEGFVADCRAREPTFIGGWMTAHHESPFIRQNNAIRKMVEDLLDAKPGPGQTLVRFLAGILDMELPDTWRVSQD